MMLSAQLSSQQALAWRAFRSTATGRRPTTATHPRCVSCSADAAPQANEQPTRRATLQTAAAVVAATLAGSPLAALAADLGAARLTDGDKLLVDEATSNDLKNKERVKTQSGLEYQDVVPGQGPSPTVGIQVVVNYVAKTPDGKIFDNSLVKGAPYYIRVGSGAIIPGVDEALLSMKTGGIRRVYVPGELSFPKGLASAPGRPKVPPKSPVIFDVQLVYIPGVSDDLEMPE